MDQVISFPDDPMLSGTRAGSQQKFGMSYILVYQIIRMRWLMRVAEIMRVAALMYEAILTDTVTTKR